MTNPDMIRGVLQSSLDVYKTTSSRAYKETSDNIVRGRRDLAATVRSLLSVFNNLTDYLEEVGGPLALGDVALEAVANNAMAAVYDPNGMSDEASAVYNNSKRFKEVVNDNVSAVRAVDEQMAREIAPLVHGLAAILGVSIDEVSDPLAQRVRETAEPLEDAQIDAVVSTEFYIHNL